MFKRVLVANRGEIARRIITACHELGIETVAVYSEADAESPPLAEADRRVCIGGPKSSDSYLNPTAILQAAEQTGAKAIHPGYGFLSENPLFAELCQQLKFSWIGPPAPVIRLMGDKASARRAMKAAGIPVVPGSEGVVQDVREARRLGREIGYPLLLKATAGGGGKGMRRCADESALEESFAQASMEAAKAFGEPGLYLERWIDAGRHIEFQFLADSFGQVIHVGERECSVQRHHQKLIEESPSTVIDPALRAEMGARVCHSMRAVGYVGAGTMEFLRDREGRLYFIEVNTRLQVEHPVTEMVSGLDLGKEQIRIAANQPLSVGQEEVRLTGHAIECRINAEDPDAGFRPSPGVIERFEPPELGARAGARVRLDTHVRTGYRIPVFYDSMIGKLIVAGDSRVAAIRAMRRALAELRIDGVKTTIPLHRLLLESTEFCSGSYDTGLLERLLPPGPAQSAEQG